MFFLYLLPIELLNLHKKGINRNKNIGGEHIHSALHLHKRIIKLLRRYSPYSTYSKTLAIKGTLFA